MIMEGFSLKSTCLSKSLDLFPSPKAKAGPCWKRRINQLMHRNVDGISPPVICCRLQSIPGDEDGYGQEPAISSDWRSFRARLIARGPAAWPAAESRDESSPRAAAELSERWAHPLHEPEPGCLLIATEKLEGIHIFERTVILLLSIGPAGPMGVILNRPSLMSIKETRSRTLDSEGTFASRPLYFGGPLEGSLFLLGPSLDGEGLDSLESSGFVDEVMRGVYYGRKEGLEQAEEMVKKNVVRVGDFRFFDGWCGWEKEQLGEEIRAGYWTVGACSPGVIGVDSVANLGLWEDILSLMGKKRLV